MASRISLLLAGIFLLATSAARAQDIVSSNFSWVPVGNFVQIISPPHQTSAGPVEVTFTGIHNAGTFRRWDNSIPQLLFPHSNHADNFNLNFRFSRPVYEFTIFVEHFNQDGAGAAQEWIENLSLAPSGTTGSMTWDGVEGKILPTMDLASGSITWAFPTGATELSMTHRRCASCAWWSVILQSYSFGVVAPLPVEAESWGSVKARYR